MSVLDKPVPPVKIIKSFCWFSRCLTFSCMVSKLSGIILYSVIETSKLSSFSITILPALSSFCSFAIALEQTTTADFKPLPLSLKEDFPPFL